MKRTKSYFQSSGVLIFVTLKFETNQNPNFPPRMRGKNGILRGYCRDKGPDLHIALCALLGNMNASEEG